MRTTPPWHALPSHITATGYVLTPDSVQLLLIFHKRLGRWLPPGGHVEPNEAPSSAAIREVAEETGVTAYHRNIGPLDLKLTAGDETQLPNPLATSAQIIHGGDSQLPSDHVHIDLLFELEASDDSEITVAEDEVQNARWFTRQEILGELNTFDSVRTYAGSQMKDPQ